MNTNFMMNMNNKLRFPFINGGGVGILKAYHCKAFTLAEVLITLGIIGIVAAMTIPTLTRAYQKKITETRLEHFYSMMTQAIKLSIADNGQVSEWIENFDRTNPEQRKAIDEKYILKYLKGVTHCADIPALAELVGAARKEIINKCGSVDSSYSSIYKLQNGSCFTLSTRLTRNNKIYIGVDVNCEQKPNGTKPQDSFGFQLMTDGRFVPVYYSNELTREDITNGTHINADMWGYPEATFGCTNKTGVTYSKHLCGALIMLDGWKIKDDYPW